MSLETLFGLLFTAIAILCGMVGWLAYFIAMECEPCE